MNENILSSLLEESLRNELACAETDWSCSRSHQRRMSRIFRRYMRNTGKPTCTEIAAPRCKLTRRAVTAALLIIILTTITGGAITFVSNSFRGTVYHDNTYLFAYDTDNSPSTIEEKYTLSVIPEGYEISEVFPISTHIITEYKNSQNSTLVFEQSAKSWYSSHVNTEYAQLHETTVNGCDAVYIEFVRESGTSSLLIWNNNKYILSLYGEFSKDELIALATQNEINGF